MDHISRTTAAIVVVFRPDADPKELLSSLRHQVAVTVVADNSLEGHAGLAMVPQREDLIRLRTRNHGGLAGAYNRAIEHIVSQRSDISHVVFLDEDSQTSTLHALLADTAAAELLRHAAVASVAAAYVDRATGLRGRYIELRRLRFHFLPRHFTGLRQVAFVINSMSVWRVSALQQIGPFNEALAIDHIDTEYCLRARQLGLQVHVHGSHEFAHSIGQRRRFSIFGREMQAGGHPPDRRYLIGRNTAWLGRRYAAREPAFAFLCLSRLAYELVGILLAEHQRAPKLWALTRGALSGLLKPMPR